MPNGFDHRFFAAACAAGATTAAWSPNDHWSKHPLFAGSVAAGCATLPDLLEPALHPNHRQLFHSFAFAAILGVGMYKLYQWEPQTEGQQILRRVLLLAGGAYLVHLAMDFTTPKSLPFLGKLS